jgi:hypothetical protein
VDFLLLVATSTAWAFASAQVVPKPFSISIRSETSVVKAGSDVWINVRLTNTSNHDLGDSGSIDNMIGRPEPSVRRSRHQRQVGSKAGIQASGTCGLLLIAPYGREKVFPRSNV